MSQIKHRDSQLRVIPKLARSEEIGDETSVQAKAAPARRQQAIPSLTGRNATGTTPPNVLAFTKPRAISQIAAQDPQSIVMTPSKSALPHDKQIDTAARNLAALTPSLPGVAPMQPTRHRHDKLVSTGWTPPSGVQAVAPRSAAPKATPAVTAWPATPAPVAPVVTPPVTPSTLMAAQSIPLPMQQPLARSTMPMPSAMPPALRAPVLTAA
ncbi:MAG: hypothetical protein M3680_13490, partial [Myxococcota bacterium]|nr:hypothetical protein [Myxococcota bacterium]